MMIVVKVIKIEIKQRIFEMQLEYSVVLNILYLSLHLYNL